MSVLLTRVTTVRSYFSYRIEFAHLVIVAINSHLTTRHRQGQTQARPDTGTTRHRHGQTQARHDTDTTRHRHGHGTTQARHDTGTTRHRHDTARHRHGTTQAWTDIRPGRVLLVLMMRGDARWARNCPYLSHCILHSHVSSTPHVITSFIFSTGPLWMPNAGHIVPVLTFHIHLDFPRLFVLLQKFIFLSF